MERSGNDFDQCALLVALLQAAGYTNTPGVDGGVGYQFGMLKMPYDATDGTHNDIHHWLGLNLVNTNWSNINTYFSNLLPNRGYPGWYDEGDNNTIAFFRVWVTLTIGSTTYYLDPAFKDSEPVAGINLSAAMGLNTNTLMTSAGGTATADFIKGASDPNVRATLQSYNSNLLATIQTTYPNASVQQILGGRRIVPWTNALSQLSPPFPLETLGGSYPEQTWTNQPTSFMSTFAVSFNGISQQWYYPQLQGQRLSLTCASTNNVGKAQLWLDDTLIMQTNTSGGSTTVTITVNHPYGSWDTGNNVPVDTGWSDVAIPNTYQCSNSTYAIIYCFEPDPKYLRERQNRLDAYLQQGLTNTSRQVVSETLNTMGLNWMVQTKQASDIMAQQLGILTQFHERVGRMAQEIGRGYYVDIYLQLDSSFQDGVQEPSDLTFFSARHTKFFDVGSYIASSMEHGLIQQLQNSGLTAASTVKILQIATTNNQAIYVANSTNWMAGANVRAHLVNYTLGTLDNLINQGYTLFLPTNGAIPVAGTGSWTGQGYVELQSTSTSRRMGMIIGGGYSGGYVSDPLSVVNAPYIDTSFYSVPTFTDITPISTPIVFSADPVNMSDASFRISATDISLGHADPMGMSFTRFYSPTRRAHNSANLGNGWVHSYNFDLNEISDPEASLGETTPAQMAPMLVATCASINLYNSQPDPKTWLVTALIAKWGVDQTISNAVSISLGDNTLEFIRQPGGALTPPANCNFSLTNTGTYKLQQRNANSFLFNSSKLLATITNQSGATMTMTYTGTNLTQIKDWKNRTLTLTYAGNPSRITKVTDSSGRVVNYGYTTNADKNIDLVYVADPENKTNTFLYDTNHQITETLDALHRVVVTNIYDSFGHITTQFTQGDTNKTWQIFWSDWQTVSQDPVGNKQRFFYDDMSRLIGQQDAVGNLSQTFYDGQNHVVMTVSPLNETNQSVYDSSNNVIQTIDPLNFTNQFIYDGQDNLVKLIDARGNASTFGYDAHFRLIGSTNGAGDWVVYTYNTDGTLASRIDPGGTNSYAYDANGILSKVIFPGGLGTNGYLNNAFGDVLSQTNARGFVTSFQYDNRRLLTNSIGPTNVTSHMVYDAIGNKLSGTDPRGFTTSNTWTVTRRLSSTIMPAVSAGISVITNIYDNRDWLTRTLNPLGAATRFTNDPAQRLIAIADPLARTTTMGYDADGRNLLSSNGAVNVTAQHFDARGSMGIMTDPAGRVVQRAYDGAGNQVTLTNRNGKIWRFQFDAANRLTNTISPLSHTSSQIYNNRGLLVSSKDPAGQTKAFNYDAKGRLTNRSDSVAATVLRYDANDNPTNVTENALTNKWSYDAYDRITSYNDIYGNLIQYKYDLNGNLTNLIYPGGKNVFYGYDGQNHMTNVTDWSGRKTSFSYDLAGQLTSINHPNGTQRLVSYDADGEATNITEKSANGSIIVLYKLGWDQAARMNTEYAAPLPHSATLPTRNMTFDDDNRMTAIDGNTIVNDLDGNMTSGPLTNDTLFAYTYDARNRLLNTGGVTNAYDAMDNRIGQTFGTNSVAYVINPNAKLPQVLIRIKNGVTNYYIYGPGLLYQITESATATNTLTYHYDYRGSTVALTDGTGTNVTDRFEYSAYATMTYRMGTNDTSFLFNGLYGVMTDPNGLLYMRARYYNPYICRFINPDPSGFSGGLNLYAFADGNPISALDPFGLSFWSVTGHFLAGAVVGVAVGVVVVLAAPEIAAAGAAALVYAGVAEATATTVAGTAVPGLIATTTVGGYTTVVNTAKDVGTASVTGNWDGVAYDAGSLTGSIIGGGQAARYQITAASEPGLTGGMSTLDVLSTYDRGAQALNGADYEAYGGELTSPLYKGMLMEDGVNLDGDPYSISTSAGTRAGTSFGLAGTGLTPTAAILTGTAVAGATGWLGDAIPSFGTSSH